MEVILVIGPLHAVLLVEVVVHLFHSVQLLFNLLESPLHVIDLWSGFLLGELREILLNVIQSIIQLENRLHLRRDLLSKLVVDRW